MINSESLGIIPLILSRLKSGYKHAPIFRNLGTIHAVRFTRRWKAKKTDDYTPIRLFWFGLVLYTVVPDSDTLSKTLSSVASMTGVQSAGLPRPNESPMSLMNLSIVRKKRPLISASGPSPDLIFRFVGRSVCPRLVCRLDLDLRRDA